MNATKAVIQMAGKRIEIQEADLDKLNGILASCPVGGAYAEDKIDPNKRIKLVAVLEVKTETYVIS